MLNNPSSEIERELSSGERLLWSGQPRRGFRLRSSDAFVIPFSLLWCGFAIFWETSVITKGAPFLFRLWGIPFVLVGLYIVFGRFIVDARTRERTFYGITSRELFLNITDNGLRLTVTSPERPQAPGGVTLTGNREQAR